MRGLLMIEPLYHQTIRGCKTQTRRSGGLDQVNGRKATKDKPAIITDPDNWEITGSLQTTMDDLTLEEVDFCEYRSTQKNIKCKPRYHVGEVLFLKEPTALIVNTASEKEFLLYKFNIAEADRRNIRWSNKLFMPEADARAFIKMLFQQFGAQKAAQDKTKKH